MAVILFLKMANGEIAELPLFGMITLGRSSSCDFKVIDTKISAKHCSFELTKKGEVIVTDLGSTNGTFINNSKIVQSAMRLNDTVLMGTTTINIDERRLTALEKRAIGITIKRPRSEPKELPPLEKKAATVIENLLPVKPAISENSTMKKKVALKKDLKEKIKLPPEIAPPESTLEQEPSSGMTKLLILEKSKRSKR
ncbi:MAG: FHA domain-containing protein [Bacteriovoracaceae bacterium]|nr:FHA domain-containing protein [Bacteriovoracaceae bacterium]